MTGFKDLFLASAVSIKSGGRLVFGSATGVVSELSLTMFNIEMDSGALATTQGPVNLIFDKVCKGLFHVMGAVKRFKCNYVSF